MRVGRRLQVLFRSGSVIATFVMSVVVRMALILALSLALLLAGCTADSERVDSGFRTVPGGFSARERFYFESLRDAVRATDLLVLGTVEEVRPGPPDGPPGEEVYYTEALVRVNELWHGKGVNKGDVLPVETLETQTYSLDWHTAGATVLLALSQGDDPARGLYYPTNSQFVFVVDGQNLSATQTDRFAELVARMTLEEVKDKVQKGP